MTKEQERWGFGSRNKLDAHIFDLGSDGSSERFERNVVKVLMINGFFEECEMVDEFETEFGAYEGVRLGVG